MTEETLNEIIEIKNQIDSLEKFYERLSKANFISINANWNAFISYNIKEGKEKYSDKLIIKESLEKLSRNYYYNIKRLVETELSQLRIKLLTY